MKISIRTIMIFPFLFVSFLCATSCVPSHLELEQKKEPGVEVVKNNNVHIELPKVEKVELQELILVAPKESEKSKKHDIKDSQKKLEPLVETKKEPAIVESLVNPKKTEIQKRTIVVKNKVTPKMSTYTHWGTSHTPTFTIRAHGKVIVPDIQDTLEIIDNVLKLEYHADFYGMRTSNDSADFILKPETKEVEITFSWDAKPRIIIKEI